MDDLTKTGVVKKKNDDGMTGILTDRNTRDDLPWEDKEFPSKGIDIGDPVSYIPDDSSGITVATDLQKI